MPETIPLPQESSQMYAGRLFAPSFSGLDNCPMANSPWQARIRRAQHASGRHSFAAEILKFYIQVADFQEGLHRRLSTVLPLPAGPLDSELNDSESSELATQFEPFLALAALSRELQGRGRTVQSDLINSTWVVSSPSDAQGFLTWTFLQPYAELKRSRASVPQSHSARALCPFCDRRPAVAVLRQMGDGAARSLVCCFCLAEWEFRRIICAGCGEENDRKLPVYNASDFDYIRLECCDTCKTHIKTIDLTRDGHADPIADDLASTPLDLWARDHGYARLQQNFLGL